MDRKCDNAQCTMFTIYLFASYFYNPDEFIISGPNYTDRPSCLWLPEVARLAGHDVQDHPREEL